MNALASVRSVDLSGSVGFSDQAKQLALASGLALTACLWLVAAPPALKAQSADSEQAGPEEARPREPRLETVRPERREALRRKKRRLGRQLRSPRQPGAEDRSTEALRQKQTGNSLVTRAAAGLAGVDFSSSSIADIDGDGNQDLLVTGNDANLEPTATLYLGDGDGSFQEAGAELTGVVLGSTSIADVDGDGNQDLLITGRDANNNQTATLYLGNGDGSFQDAGAGLTGVSFSSTSIADVNGDGNQDLLITGFDQINGPTTTLYLGNGDGSFQEANAGLTGVRDASTSIADVDGDGNQDLLITGEDANDNSTATLYLGGGDGSFSEASAGLTGVDKSSTSIADVDGDGNQDLLITGSDANFDPTTTLYLGGGDGSFSEASAGLTGVDESSTSIADVDGDGNQDLLIAGEDANGDRTATLYLGGGDGSFSEASAGLTGVIRSSTSIADIDGDGDNDLLITGRDDLFFEASARLYVNRTVQTGSNQAPRFARPFGENVTEGQPLAPGAPLPQVVEAGDPDGDVISIGAPGTPNASVTDRGNGVADVRFAPDRDQAGSSVNVSVEASDSEGAGATSETSVEVTTEVAAFEAGLTGVRSSSTSIADVDGDGNQDLLISGYISATNDFRTTLYLGNGDGSFSEAGAGLTDVAGSATSIADVNGDGNQDLLIAGADANLDPTATLYLGNGDGSFQEADAGLTGVEFGSTSIADMDGDGNQDLLINGQDANGDQTATLYLGNGDGSFSEANAGLAGTVDGSTSIADVNADGDLDLLITGDVGRLNLTATLYLGNGDGSFSEASADLTGVFRSSSSIADVDGDGNQDLLITGGDANGDQTATLYLGNGDGSFSQASAGLTGVDESSTSIADVDGDGNQDLLITGDDTNGDPTATLYLGGGDGSFQEAGIGLAGVGSDYGTSTSIADVDGDRNPDLLVTGDTGANAPESTILYENLFDNPLPVELASFRGSVLEQDGGAGGTASGDAVQLTWKTASETESAGFEVQRKLSGKASRKGNSEGWSQVGYVQSKADGGTTTEPKAYRYVDEDIPFEADSATYRLRQVDLDGSATLTSPVTVGLSRPAGLRLLPTAPNPARSEVTVRYAVPEQAEGEVALGLYDVLGRQVRSVSLDASGVEAGRHRRRLSVEGLASGAYFLRITAGDLSQTRHVTVVR